MSDADPSTNAPSPARTVCVESGFDGQRIDNFLIRLLKGVPKSYIYRILRKGEVRVNKGRIKADHRLAAGDMVRIPPLREAEKAPPPQPGQRVLGQIEGSILFEDKRILVLDKPSGIAVHGGSGLDYGVIEALRVLRPHDKELELVHRLDRDTSGLLMIAKKRSALRVLHELLRNGVIEKRYLALVAGRWERDRATVDAPLFKNTLQSGERMVRVDPRGKPAQTLFQVRERLGDTTLVEARLLTGRTHQIRVHLAHLGTPILGDPKYGDEAANRHFRELGLKRLFLHAELLRLTWPEEKQPMEFRAPLEPGLAELLMKLRNA